MNEHDQISEHGEQITPDPVLTSVCCIVSLMQITKNVLTHLNGLGIAVPEQTIEGTVDDRICKEIYTQLSNKVRGVEDV